MELRTRILPKMLNSEVEAYLEHNDIIFVPVGTIEMHGGYPLDSETVISEAFALKMAEACDGLVLTGLQFFYAGATASGRGTVQVSVRQGIDYLSAVAHSLLRQGFKRQVYLSFHGPAMMTCSPMVRDFFDETGVPILYIDLSTQMMKSAQGMMVAAMQAAAAKKAQAADAKEPQAADGLPAAGQKEKKSQGGQGAMNAEAIQKFMRMFHGVTVGSYDIMNRLEDVPLVTGYQHMKQQSCAMFNDLFAFASQSGSIGYCFADHDDHMSTIDLPTAEARAELAAEGRAVIEQTVKDMNPVHIVEQMRKLEAYNRDAEEKYPWMPSAFNRQ